MCVFASSTAPSTGGPPYLVGASVCNSRKRARTGDLRVTLQSPAGDCWLELRRMLASAGRALRGDSQVGDELIFCDRLAREVNVRIVEEHVLPVDAKETERH